MKVISLLQPWATLVVIGAKKIETRSWNTKFRGPILIHASKKMTKAQIELGQEFNRKYGVGLGYVEDLPTGAIIGKVNLIETAPTKHFLSLFGDNPKTGLAAKLNADNEKAFGDYSPNRYGWLLSDPIQFVHPIPVKGARSLWYFDIPDHFHIPIAGGGHATFPQPPDKETFEAVNSMIEIAKKNLK